MTDSNIYVAEEAIPLASLPDAKIEQRKGDTTLRVTVTANAAFSAAQIAACSVYGVETSIGLGVTGGTIVFTGTVSGFGVREGHSIVQISNAAASIVWESPQYVTIYPPEYSDDYVKATSYYGLGFEPYLALDPSIPMSGGRYEQSWMTGSGTITNQRFHVAFDSAQVVKRIQYCNSHNDGYNTDCGVQNITVYGSNDPTAFADLVWGNDDNWTEIVSSVSFMTRHTETVDDAIIESILLTNYTAYQYYAIKCSNNWGGTYMGIRKLIFQVLEV